MMVYTHITVGTKFLLSDWLQFSESQSEKGKVCTEIIRTLFSLSLFAVNFHVFNFELEED